MNLEPELPKAVGDAPVVEIAAAADDDAAVDRVVVADTDHHEMVDADTSDPAEHGDQGDLGDTAAAGAADGGVAA